jgi:tetratricopeptide (TPR) repeat protein
MEYSEEQVVRYVDDEMDGEERQALETAMAADADLVRRIALYREMKAELSERLGDDEKREALGRTLADMRERYFGAASSDGDGVGARVVGRDRGGDEIAGVDRVDVDRVDVDRADVDRVDVDRAAGEKGRVVPMRRWITGVAAAAVAVFAMVMLWPAKEDVWTSQLFSKPVIENVERGSGGDTLMQAASALYNKHDYAGAIRLFDTIVAGDGNNWEAAFYRGVAKLQMDSVEAARPDLERVFASESLFKWEAAYYLGVSYGVKKDEAHAREWLEKIPEGAPYRKEAQALLKKMK